MGEGVFVEAADAAFGAYGEGQGEGVPILVGVRGFVVLGIGMERVPAVAVVEGDIGAVGSGADPDAGLFVVGDGRSIAVGERLGGEPGAAAVAGVGGSAGGFGGPGVVAAYYDPGVRIAGFDGVGAGAGRAAGQGKCVGLERLGVALIVDEYARAGGSSGDEGGGELLIEKERGVAGGERAFVRESFEAGGLGRAPGVAAIGGFEEDEAAVDGVAEQFAVFVGVVENERVPEAVGVGVGVEELPGVAAVSGFVEAGLVALAAREDDGDVGIEGLDGAEVEVLGAGRDGAGLPETAAVFSAEDGAVGSGGPGNAVADGVNAAEVGGGVGGLDLPLCQRGERDENERAEEEERGAHGSSVAEFLCGIEVGVLGLWYPTSQKRDAGHPFSRWVCVAKGLKAGD